MTYHRVGFIRKILSWVLQTQGKPREKGLHRPHTPIFLRYITSIFTGRVYSHHSHVFKITSAQSKALISFSAAFSGIPAKTSSIPESPISVETPLVNTHSRGIYYVVCCTLKFLFFFDFLGFIIELVCKEDNCSSVLPVWLMSRCSASVSRLAQNPFYDQTLPDQIPSKIISTISTI